jgi:hypothetical protein
MGISPVEAKKMSVWELAAVSERWVEAHDTGQHDGKLSDGEKDEIWAWMRQEGYVGRKKGNGAGPGSTQAPPGR